MNLKLYIFGNGFIDFFARLIGVVIFNSLIYLLIKKKIHRSLSIKNILNWILVRRAGFHWLVYGKKWLSWKD